MKNQVYEFKVKEILRVVDGDTVDLTVFLGFYVTQEIRVRLLDVDAPEIRGKEKIDGFKIKALAAMWFDDHKDDELWIETRKTGKYGRWLGIIRAKGNQFSFNDYINFAIADLAQTINENFIDD